MGNKEIRDQEKSDALKKFNEKCRRRKIVKEMTAKGLVQTVSLDLSIPEEEFDKIKNGFKKINRAPYPSIIID